MNNNFDPCMVCSDFTNHKLVFHSNLPCKQNIKDNIKCPSCGAILEISYNKDTDKTLMVNK